MKQIDLEEYKHHLYALCRYGIDEPNHVKYNLALLDTIDRMSEESVLFAISDIERAMQ